MDTWTQIDYPLRHLESKLLSCIRDNRSLHICTSQQRVRVRERTRTQRSLRRCVRTLTTKDSINDHRIAILITALSVHHLLSAILEHSALNEGLSAHARVHASILLVVVVVEDMCCAKAEERATRGDFVEVVVGVGYAEVAGVFGGVGVGVTYERALGLESCISASNRMAPSEQVTHVVMEIRMRNCHIICGVRQVDKTVVGILANILVARQVAMINPNIGRLIDGNRVAVCSKNFGDLQVPDDHVLLTENGETNTSES